MAKLHRYRVRWEIDVEGSTPAQAALRVLDIMRDRSSIATVFLLKDERRKTTKIDLEAFAICDSCGFIFKTPKDNDFATITDLNERIEPGGMVPACECPKCGSLAYPATKMGGDPR